MRAIENERVRQKVADIELRRGPLEGLNEIADDPHYLAEWQQRSDEKAEAPAGGVSPAEPVFNEPQPAIQPLAIDVVYPEPEAASLQPAVLPVLSESADPEFEPERLQVRVLPAADSFPRRREANGATDDRPIRRPILSSHVATDLDRWGFLPCLRRGEAVPSAKVAELEVRSNGSEKSCEERKHQSPHRPCSLSPGTRVAGLAHRRLSGRF